MARTGQELLVLFDHKILVFLHHIVCYISHPACIVIYSKAVRGAIGGQKASLVFQLLPQVVRQVLHSATEG